MIQIGKHYLDLETCRKSEKRAFFQLTLLILLFRAKSRNIIFKGILNYNINQIGQPLALQQ